MVARGGAGTRQEREWRTRKARIDPRLASLGWKLARFDAAEAMRAAEPRAIEEYDTANGPADYALTLDGRVAGIEVKSGSSVSLADFRTLDLLRDRLGEGFANGVVLAHVPEPLSLGDRRTVLPHSALWAR